MCVCQISLEDALHVRTTGTAKKQKSSQAYLIDMFGICQNRIVIDKFKLNSTCIQFCYCKLDFPLMLTVLQRWTIPNVFNKCRTFNHIVHKADSNTEWYPPWNMNTTSTNRCNSRSQNDEKKTIRINSQFFSSLFVWYLLLGIKDRDQNIN